MHFRGGKFMNVTLNPEFEELVNQKITSGVFNSASEVISEGLRLLKEQDELHRLRLEELKREIAKGIDSLDRGEGKPLNMEANKNEGRRRLAAEQGESNGTCNQVF